MNCEEVDRLLSFCDSEARVEPVRLRKHFESCPRCREVFSEVDWYLAQEDGTPPALASLSQVSREFPDPRGRPSRFPREWVILIAAMVLVVVSWIGWPRSVEEGSWDFESAVPSSVRLLVDRDPESEGAKLPEVEIEGSSDLRRVGEGRRLMSGLAWTRKVDRAIDPARRFVVFVEARRHRWSPRCLVSSSSGESDE